MWIVWAMRVHCTVNTYPALWTTSMMNRNNTVHLEPLYEHDVIAIKTPLCTWRASDHWNLWNVRNVAENNALHLITSPIVQCKLIRNESEQICIDLRTWSASQAEANEVHTECSYEENAWTWHLINAETRKIWYVWPTKCCVILAHLCTEDSDCKKIARGTTPILAAFFFLHKRCTSLGGKVVGVRQSYSVWEQLA